MTKVSVKVTVTNMDNCTAIATTDVNCSALPVRLISFEAAQTENEIQLKWEAVDASNFSYFAIERGSNAKNFTVIEKINFDYNERFYNMTDRLPLNGTNYYRLNMVDTDGSHAYSKTINVKHHDGKIVLRNLKILPPPMLFICLPTFNQFLFIS